MLAISLPALALMTARLDGAVSRRVLVIWAIRPCRLWQHGQQKGCIRSSMLSGWSRLDLIVLRSDGLLKRRASKGKLATLLMPLLTHSRRAFEPCLEI